MADLNGRGHGDTAPCPCQGRPFPCLVDTDIFRGLGGGLSNRKWEVFPSGPDELLLPGTPSLSQVSRTCLIKPPWSKTQRPHHPCLGRASPGGVWTCHASVYPNRLQAGASSAHVPSLQDKASIPSCLCPADSLLEQGRVVPELSHVPEGILGSGCLENPQLVLEVRALQGRQQVKKVLPFSPRPLLRAGGPDPWAELASYPSPSSESLLAAAWMTLV